MKGSDTDYTLLQSTMTPDRNHTASVTDTNGSQTSYTYNASTEQLTGTSTYNPETGKTISTNRVYNASNGRQTQMYIDGALSMSYAYKSTLPHSSMSRATVLSPASAQTEAVSCVRRPMPTVRSNGCSSAGSSPASWRS